MRHDHQRAAFLAASVLACSAVVEAEVHVAGDLPRQAELGFGVAAGPSGLAVRDVAAGSPAFDAGLRPGDVIRAVGGVAFARPHVGEALLERAHGGHELRLDVDGAAGARRTLRFTPAAKPLERLEGLDSYHGVVDTPDGARLRTILTRPEGSRRPLPAIFFVQWVSCDSVEFTTPGAWIDVYRAVAQRSGMAMIRVERSPNGDSQGPACHGWTWKPNWRTTATRSTRWSARPTSTRPAWW